MKYLWYQYGNYFLIVSPTNVRSVISLKNSRNCVQVRKYNYRMFVRRTCRSTRNPFNFLKFPLFGESIDLRHQVSKFILQINQLTHTSLVHRTETVFIYFRQNSFESKNLLVFHFLCRHKSQVLFIVKVFFVWLIRVKYVKYSLNFISVGMWCGRLITQVIKKDNG